jgi:hypothetical protein
MNVRIRLPRGVPIDSKTGKNRHMALTFATLLVPAAMMASVLALWRLASDVSATNEFAISEGILSHWAPWAVIAIALAVAAQRLNHYGRSGRFY